MNSSPLQQRLSVVIPSRSGSKDLEACLSSVKAQNLSAFQKLEVLVVVNGGGFDPNLTKRFSEVTWLKSKKGAGAARNKGFHAASNDRVYFLDDDCTLPDSRFLERITNNSLQMPQAILGGYYMNPEFASMTVRGFNLLANMWLSSGGDANNGTRLLGGNFLLRKSLLWSQDFKGKLFETKITYGASEAELFQRLKEKGMVFCLRDDLNVFHNPQNTNLPRLLRKCFHQGHNEAQFSLSLNRKSLGQLFREFITLSKKWETTGRETLICFLLWGASFIGNIYTKTSQTRLNHLFKPGKRKVGSSVLKG